MNFVHIVGRLVKDPETRFTADGKKVATLVVASNTWKSGKEETMWWRVSLWGDRWDKIIQHFSKGKPIMIGGELRKPEMYTDKNGQQQIGSLEIWADYIKFVPFGRQDSADNKQNAGTQNAGQQKTTEQTQGSYSTGSASAPQTGFAESSTTDEEALPF